MAVMRTIAVKLDKVNNKASAWIPALQEEIKASLVIDIIGTNVRAYVPWVTVETTINNVVSRVSTIMYEQLGGRWVLQSQEVQGAM